MHNYKTPFILYGGDYNPDQWDDITIEEDMELFKKAGVNLLILPVFAWARIEPREGEYNFEWLDNILHKIWENNIHFFLATPTTAQPAWLSHKYEDVLPVDIAGRKRTHGMRVFFCVNSVHYRERAAALAKVMAERYGNFPGLAGWHVSNEYGTYCYCEHCQIKFREWLWKRYHTLEELNLRWHTSFWGRILYDFDEVMLPTQLNDDFRFNPAIQLDYMRFVTDSTLECYLNEADILKQATPDLPVFTNISGYIKNLDQFKMVPHMDYAGWDNYPTPDQKRSIPALKHNIMRAAKDGASFLVAEQSPNQQNWQPYNKLKKPGEIRRIAYQGLAYGSDSSLYFQMRQSIAGQEKHHGAFISHAGWDSRIFQECCELGQELKSLGDVFLKGRIHAQVGIVFDWDNWWALELTSGPSKDMDYFKQVHNYYEAFYKQNIPVDILKTTSDFSGYKILVLPMLYMMKEGIAERITVFVENGGTLLATYMTGHADENDRCIFGAYPGPLKDVLGMWVEETDALYPEEENEIRIINKNLSLKEKYRCRFLCDVIRLTTAEALAVYGECFYQNTPVVTRNVYGNGQSYYLGSEPDEDFLMDFTKVICSEQEVKAEFTFSGEIEISTRYNQTGKTTFMINHGEEAGNVNLGTETFEDLIHKTMVIGWYELPAGDVAVLFRKKKE